MTREVPPEGSRAPIAGCAFVSLMALALVAALVIAHPVLISVAVACAIVLVIVFKVQHGARRRAAVARFKEAYPDRRMLIVYTDSPHWGRYIEANWMPRWGAHAIVLNRSRPWKHDSAEAVLWRETSGYREHTPLVVVLGRNGSAETVRFFKAFRDNKHGKPQKLRDAEAAVDALLSRAASGGL